MTLNVATKGNHAAERMITHGLLTRVHGKCALVRQIALKLQGGFDDLMSVTDMIRSVGAVPSKNRLQMKMIVASGSLPQKLGLAEDEPYGWLERMRGATCRICRRASFSFC
ncbi:hypothetical protein FVF58_44465 [Paraburkholderia panacisoli]|uniref:Uncharacterized protein n=1 Tax=Paraburkholderia panacisoli TaxID=2603818 RepID=A0A5B0G4W5_9BURK|nr:hypothetical protein [Paraburkholderia panacisoli]KAA0998437.1 hypothetical protein FVF58_44465 [Paraburkholderia panacisoli]